MDFFVNATPIRFADRDFHVHAFFSHSLQPQPHRT